MWDWAEVKSCLGFFMSAQAERIEAEFKAGLTHAYRMESDDYSGEGLLRFHDDGKTCHVLGFQGINVKNVIRDLIKLIQRTGASTITLNTFSLAHARLFAAAGFELDNCAMKLDLNHGL